MVTEIDEARKKKVLALIHFAKSTLHDARYVAGQITDENLRSQLLSDIDEFEV